MSEWGRQSVSFLLFRAVRTGCNVLHPFLKTPASGGFAPPRGWLSIFNLSRGNPVPEQLRVFPLCACANAFRRNFAVARGIYRGRWGDDNITLCPGGGKEAGWLKSAGNLRHTLSSFRDVIFLCRFRNDKHSPCFSSFGPIIQPTLTFK